MCVIKIRPAKTADFNEIFRLLEQLWKYKKADKKLLKIAYLKSMKEKKYRAFLAVCGGRVLGYAGTIILNLLWQAGTICHLNELVVDERLRGKGIGSLMMNHIETYAKKKKCRGIDLESAKSRKKTHKFYKDRGYDARAYFFVKLFNGDR
jgi:GNAT superfamily N-acetyltransferase